MNRYKVLLNGQNLLIDLDGIDKYGFYTTRYVLADSAIEAKKLAIQLLRDEKELKEVTLNNIADLPRFVVDEIIEIEDSAEPVEQIRGFTWYLEEEQDNKPLS